MTLPDFIDAKRQIVAERKKHRPLSTIQQGLLPSERNFLHSISNFHTNFILEFLRATPEIGTLRNVLDIREVARIYARYADAISIVISQPFFNGTPEDITTVRDIVTQPILASCSVVDEYQIYEARSLGADAITFAVSLTTDEELSNYIGITRQLNMTAVLTVRSAEDITRALKTDVATIKINNPELSTDESPVEVFEKMSAKIPESRIKVSDSKIMDNRDVMKLKGVCSAFIVGQPMLQQHHLICAVKSVVFGATKISGVTSVEDASLALQAGTAYIGVELSEGRPRRIDLQTAKTICELPEGLMVGLFVNDSIDLVADTVTDTGLHGVQLHGDETAEYIIALRKRLPEGTLIFKGVPILDHVPDLSKIPADYFVVDTFDHTLRGATGRSFDWTYLTNHPLLDKIFLAGGINPTSAQDARLTGTFGLDITSGVEANIGIKDAKKLGKLFDSLR